MVSQSDPVFWFSYTYLHFLVFLQWMPASVFYINSSLISKSVSEFTHDLSKCCCFCRSLVFFDFQMYLSLQCFLIFHLIQRMQMHYLGIFKFFLYLFLISTLYSRLHSSVVTKIIMSEIFLVSLLLLQYLSIKRASLWLTFGQRMPFSFHYQISWISITFPSTSVTSLCGFRSSVTWLTSYTLRKWKHLLSLGNLSTFLLNENNTKYYQLNQQKLVNNFIVCQPCIDAICSSHHCMM